MTATAPPDVPVRSLRDILTALKPVTRSGAARCASRCWDKSCWSCRALCAKFAGETTKGLDLPTEELEAFDASTTRRLDGLAARGWTPRQRVPVRHAHGCPAFAGMNPGRLAGQSAAHRPPARAGVDRSRLRVHGSDRTTPRVRGRSCARPTNPATAADSPVRTGSTPRKKRGTKPSRSPRLRGNQSAC